MLKIKALPSIQMILQWSKIICVMILDMDFKLQASALNCSLPETMPPDGPFPVDPRVGQYNTCKFKSE